MGLLYCAEHIALGAAAQICKGFAVFDIDIVPGLGMRPLLCAANLIWPQRQLCQTFAVTNLLQGGGGFGGQMILCNLNNNAMTIGTESQTLAAAKG
jgi:hypothetical protein